MPLPDSAVAFPNLFFQMVYFVLVLAAIVFGVATYLLLDAGADREFKSEVS